MLHDAAGSLPYANSLGMATAEEIHRVFTIVMHTGFAAVVSTEEWLQALASGEAFAFSLSVKNAVLSASTACPGRNFNVAGFGVDSVWMNMGSLSGMPLLNEP